MNHDIILPCSFLKPLRCKFSFFMAPCSPVPVVPCPEKTMAGKGWDPPHPHGPLSFQTGGQRHLLEMRAFAAGGRTISSPCKCAVRWVSETYSLVLSCAFLMAGQKVAFKPTPGKHRASEHILGSGALCIWLWVRRLSITQVQSLRVREEVI